MLTTTEERKMAGKLSENGTSEKSFNNRILSAKKLNCLPKTRTKKMKKCTHMLFGATQFILKNPYCNSLYSRLKGLCENQVNSARSNQMKTICFSDM